MNRRKLFHAEPTHVPPAIPDANVGFTDFVAQVCDGFIDSLAEVVDFTTSAIYTEVALQSYNLAAAARNARFRLLGQGPRAVPSLAAPYVGVGGILSVTLAGFLSSLAFLVSLVLLTGPSDFDIRQMARDSGVRAPARAFFDFTSPDSARFVSAPIYASFVAACVTFVGIYIVAEAYEVTTDSMFYCFILESDGYGDSYAHTRIGHAVEHPCNMRFAPEDVKTLLVQALDIEQEEEHVFA